ncbi:hypothetical protein [Streptosporangium roseum]|uniref:hypothetical protein n=1 Tax=Streptosporangium roseum TaxID=2001 RepID=UPI001C54D716|nr:hypothetical protein [Streptosporangium roseum]
MFAWATGCAEPHVRLGNRVRGAVAGLHEEAAAGARGRRRRGWGARPRRSAPSPRRHGPHEIKTLRGLLQYLLAQAADDESWLPETGHGAAPPYPSWKAGGKALP